MGLSHSRVGFNIVHFLLFFSNLLRVHFRHFRPIGINLRSAKNPVRTMAERPAHAPLPTENVTFDLMDGRDRDGDVWSSKHGQPTGEGWGDPWLHQDRASGVAGGVAMAESCRTQLVVPI